MVKLGKVVAGPKLTPYDPQCQKEPFFPVSSVPLGSWKVLAWDKHLTVGQSLCPVGVILSLVEALRMSKAELSGLIVC